MSWRIKRDADRRALLTDDVDREAGTRAKERAQSSLDEARKLWPEVHQVAKSLRDLRHTNGFADQIKLAMGVRDR